MGETRDLFNKTGNTKGMFHAKMGTLKDRNYKNLREAEVIKKRWQEYREELHKKDINDPDTHSSVLAWRIPGTGQPGRLLSMGSHRVGHN